MCGSGGEYMACVPKVAQKKGSIARERLIGNNQFMR